MARKSSGANPDAVDPSDAGAGGSTPRHGQGLAKAAAKMESVSAELVRKAAQLDALSERLAAFDVWTRPERGRRQPRFTRDEIAAAAVRIADTEGFDALSMRRLAAELDSGTMTLYHYVRTKDELLSLVNDAVMGELVIPDDEMPSHWRDALTAIAGRSRDVMRRHPWSLELRDDPAPGPNGVRHFEQSMRAVGGLDLTLAERFELVTAVDEYVFGYCLTERASVLDDTTAPAEYRDYVVELVATGEFPALEAMIDDPGFDEAFAVFAACASDPARFGRNLQRLLDGCESTMLAPRRRRARS